MSNSHDEIKQLLKASRTLLSNEKLNEDINTIRKQYTLLTEDDTTNKLDLSKSVEDKIDSDTKPNDDKSQGYRISGGLLVLHGKNQTDLELTTDEKLAFQETMDEFVGEVADLVDFNKLNIYPNNVEWSGKIIDADIEFFFSIGEENGVYINGDMKKTDDDFLETVNKLKTFYEKFKSKWAAILADRKKTIK
jgi:hypothetical protein